jgi:tRNA U34 5-methylaminomethyl-2-thiouridine-forming methyltransferase MnmC
MHIPPYLVNEPYNDRYFDVVDAIEEARHIFFLGNRIMERLSAVPRGERGLRIGETGFGAGRVLIALLDSLDASGLTDVALSYNSVELHPMTAGRMKEILEQFRPRVGPLIDLVAAAYGTLAIAVPQWHRLEFTRPFGVVSLNLWIGEALEMVNALAAPCDAWFLDGHGPKKNPDMWRPELLRAIGEKTVIGGTVATYTVARVVRSGLEAAGFSVERVPGVGGKNVVLRGDRIANAEEPFPQSPLQ